jgi:hypothetical protein
VDVGCDILLFFDRILDRVAPWRGGVWDKDLFVNIFCVHLFFVMCCMYAGRWRDSGAVVEADLIVG